MKQVFLQQPRLSSVSQGFVSVLSCHYLPSFSHVAPTGLASRLVMPQAVQPEALGSLEPPPEPLLLLPVLLSRSLWANRPYDTSLQDVDKSLEQKFTKTLFPCSKPQAACTCRRLTLDLSHPDNWEPTIHGVWDVESSHWNVIQHEG